MKNNIKEFCDKLGWHNDVLARKAGISTATVGNIESGRSKRPEKNSIEGIVKAFGEMGIKGHQIFPTLYEKSQKIQNSKPLKVEQKLEGRIKKLRSSLKSKELGLILDEPLVDKNKIWMKYGVIVLAEFCSGKGFTLDDIYNYFNGPEFTVSTKFGGDEACEVVVTSQLFAGIDELLGWNLN